MNRSIFLLFLTLLLNAVSGQDHQQYFTKVENLAENPLGISIEKPTEKKLLAPFEEGDLIIGLNGLRIRNIFEFNHIRYRSFSSEALKLTVLRQKKLIDIDVPNFPPFALRKYQTKDSTNTFQTWFSYDFATELEKLSNSFQFSNLSKDYLYILLKDLPASLQEEWINATEENKKIFIKCAFKYLALKADDFTLAKTIEINEDLNHLPTTKKYTKWLDKVISPPNISASQVTAQLDASAEYISICYPVPVNINVNFENLSNDKKFNQSLKDTIHEAAFLATAKEKEEKIVDDEMMELVPDKTQSEENNNEKLKLEALKSFKFSVLNYQGRASHHRWHRGSQNNQNEWGMDGDESLDLIELAAKSYHFFTIGNLYLQKYYLAKTLQMDQKNKYFVAILLNLITNNQRPTEEIIIQLSQLNYLESPYYQHKVENETHVSPQQLFPPLSQHYFGYHFRRENDAMVRLADEYRDYSSFLEAYLENPTKMQKQFSALKEAVLKEETHQDLTSFWVYHTSYNHLLFNQKLITTYFNNALNQEALQQIYQQLNFVIENKIKLQPRIFFEHFILFFSLDKKYAEQFHHKNYQENKSPSNVNWENLCATPNLVTMYHSLLKKENKNIPKSISSQIHLLYEYAQELSAPYLKSSQNSHYFAPATYTEYLNFSTFLSPDQEGIADKLQPPKLNNRNFWLQNDSDSLALLVYTKDKKRLVEIFHEEHLENSLKYRFHGNLFWQGEFFSEPYDFFKKILFELFDSHILSPMELEESPSSLVHQIIYEYRDEKRKNNTLEETYIQELIKDLSSDDFFERDAAQKKLFFIPKGSITILEGKMQQAKDLETFTRIEYLLKNITGNSEKFSLHIKKQLFGFANKENWQQFDRYYQLVQDDKKEDSIDLLLKSINHTREGNHDLAVGALKKFDYHKKDHALFYQMISGLLSMQMNYLLPAEERYQLITDKQKGFANLINQMESVQLRAMINQDSLIFSRNNLWQKNAFKTLNVFYQNKPENFLEELHKSSLNSNYYDIEKLLIATSLINQNYQNICDSFQRTYTNYHMAYYYYYENEKRSYELMTNTLLCLYAFMQAGKQDEAQLIEKNYLQKNSLWASNASKFMLGKMTHQAFASNHELPTNKIYSLHIQDFYTNYLIAIKLFDTEPITGKKHAEMVMKSNHLDLVANKVMKELYFNEPDNKIEK